MNKIVGAIFILAASILHSARYISAMLIMQITGIPDMNNDFVVSILNSDLSSLKILSIISLIIGSIYILLDIIRVLQKKLSNYSGTIN